MRAEVQRRDLLAASEAYTTELRDQVGAPTASRPARAADVARRIVGRSHRKAG